MSNRLFDRKVNLLLATRLDPSKTNADRFFNSFTRETSIENLRVSFTVEKSLKKEPNTCKVAVYNLAKGTRAEFQTLPAHLTLLAGYGSDLKQIYKGDVLPGGIASRHEGTEWVTSIQAGTGAQGYKHGRISKTFRAGANVKTIATEAAKAMGLSIPKSVSEGRAMLNQIVGGVTLNGLSSRELERILKPHGLTYSVQDDRLQILTDDGTSRARAVVVSPELGMVGSPELGAPEGKGKSPILKVRTLLDGDLTPGGFLQLQSRDISGNFKILRVTHVGDNFGQPWYSDVEARPL